MLSTIDSVRAALKYIGNEHADTATDYQIRLYIATQRAVNKNKYLNNFTRNRVEYDLKIMKKRLWDKLINHMLGLPTAFKAR
jgi:hypothetical protein